MNIDEIIKKAKEAGSYFMTVSIKDKNKEEGDLNHYAFQKEFSRDEIIHSVDASIMSMGIKNVAPTDITIPKTIEYDKRRPLKIAIFSHGATMPDSWSIGKAIRNQIKILVSYGHNVVYYTQEKSKLTDKDIGCEVRNLVPSFRREKGIVNNEAKKKMIDMLRGELTSSFDIAITHDFYLQDTITYRDGIKECGVNIPWLHFCRSGVAEYIDWDMPNARYVYLNKTDAKRFSKHVGIPIEKVRFIPNEKDPNFLFQFDIITKMITDKMNLKEKDIIMTYAVCSTRLQAKGLTDIIKIFVELKRLGKKVALIVANSNGRRRVDDLKREMSIAKEMGLNEDEFCFTSLMADEKFKIESELPNKVVNELMRISNLMIFASRAEVCSNLALEASMNRNLMVLNSDLPSLYDFFDREHTLSFPFTSNNSLHYSHRDSASYAKLAKQIIGELESNKSDMNFRKIFRMHNSQAIYKILSDVLYEDIK